ncbi:hypothetical protein DPEC_G00205750 [Dallia pectoralis]|uniref:Uncharacterized protein n=1 Tax=Dallia pectoralis TaxID=75939 RepID=A0ACC2G4K9_DALPE|nr:hypothetical protein DPEC_G00205750 [Dallia pectoralis]
MIIQPAKLEQASLLHLVQRFHPAWFGFFCVNNKSHLKLQMECKRIIFLNTFTIFSIFNQVCYVLMSSGHPTCDQGTPISVICLSGFVPEGGTCVCPKGSYGYKQNGLLKCERCTLVCKEKDNLIEVKECRLDSNRECHCDRGYFCKSKGQFTCRRCTKCEHGTFSDTPNLNASCKPHTDCKQKGMIMTTKGSATLDRVCVLTSFGLQTSTVYHVFSTSEHSSPVNSKDIVPSLVPSETSPAVSAFSPLSTHEGEKSPITGESHIVWLLILGVTIGGVLLVLTYRGCSLQSMNMWKGPIYEKHAFPFQERNQCQGVVELEDKGLPSLGGLQQVAVAPSGGEKISNTVGSIYIYSPGTVVLGSNKSEKKSDKGESEGEGCSGSNVPQQETLCLLPGRSEIGTEGMITQEEIRKELCYPIPATEN